MSRSQITRRAVLAMGGIAASRPLSGAAAQPHTAVSFAVPADACDCHTHIFGNPAQFPWFAGRTYTPESALPEEMGKLHEALHIRRVVIVTPSVYGTDNSATLFGMKARGANARGVAVIDEKTPAAELDRLSKAGFRGMRINLATGGQNDPVAGRRRLDWALKQAKSLGWHVQMFTTPNVIAAIRDLVAGSDVPVVFDHFGGAKAAAGMGQPGFSHLLELVRSGHAYVKVSGAYRASSNGPDYRDAAPLARALIAANSDRILWGTDWPHPDTTIRAGHPATEVTPVLQIDDGLLMNQLAVWAPDAAVRKKILVDNPARLYRF
ncbi:MAG TPA: amidohydrolase family protein [Bryobacteraceae bacterium]|nr:amidohydrolase family protein [Bryobacteraceae bacterium]